MRQIAIVLAAGRGKRMNSKVAKQYLTLLGKPVLYYALQCFEKSSVDDVILVTAEEEIAYCRKEIIETYGFSKVQSIIAGGRERYHSVYEGLKEAGRFLGTADGIIYIHDGARPFIEEEILLRAKESAERFGSGVAGMPVKDTIKIVDKEGCAVDTPNRAFVWQVQTPQTFLYSIIRPAYDKLMDAEKELLAQGITVTDDAMVAELFTENRVRLVRGSYENIKITTPEDLIVAEGFLQHRLAADGPILS